MRHFIDRYPRFFAASPEFRDIQQALEAELEALWAARDGAAEQLCLETATWGLSYWEQTLGLSADRQADLEVRRSRVRAKLRSVGVTTVEAVRSVAESFFPGGVQVVEEAGRFRVEIRLSWKGEAPADPKRLAAALREIMPAHLSWGFRVSMEAEAPLCLGGRLASQVTLPVPEAADSFRFEGRAGIGGKFALVAKFPVLGIA